MRRARRGYEAAPRRGDRTVLAALRRRAAPAAAAVLTVVAGLSVRSVLTGDLAKYAGDALYVLLIFWLVLVVAPRTRGWVAAAVAYGVSVAVELFQLTGIPAELGAHSTLARLVLGTTFNAPDLPFYAVGAAAGWLLHRLAGRFVGRRSRTVHT